MLTVRTPAVFMLLLAALPAAAADLGVAPPAAALTGPHARQHLRAVVRDGGRATGDRTAQAAWASSDPRVATVDAEGVVHAVGDGAATVTATLDGTVAKATVTVTGTQQPWAWSYRQHVLPVLTKAGCNSGACHGALAGMGGLKLSLRGYDPDSDHIAMTEQALGRRIDRVHPEQSLLLLKAVRGLPHGGGKKFDTDTDEYRRLLEWVATGAAPADGREPAVVKVEVAPAAWRLQPKDAFRAVVVATRADGRQEDVTAWAKFSSSEEGVATVDEEGQVTVVGPGEAAVNVWYSNLVTSATVSVPRTADLAHVTWDERNLIDAHVNRKLKALNVPPSPGCTDGEFARRAFLDVAGCLPTPDELKAFLADARPDKRDRLVEALMERPEFVDYWAHKRADWFLVSSKKLTTPAMWAFHRHLRQSVSEDTPWDRFSRELLTVQGSNLQNGAANYYVMHKDVADLTESTAVTFLGMSITCARCHNHPLEKWTQDQYWGMANLFSRVGMKNGDGANEIFVQSQPSGDVAHPRRGTPVPPAALDGPPVDPHSPADRRAAFADWLTDAGNPYFAKAYVNRVWRNFFGRGLVEAEDDLRATNPPSNAELFDALAADFVAGGYRTKPLIRRICASAAYQRSSVPLAENAGDDRYCSHAQVRRLPAEVILDAYAQITGVATRFDQVRAGGGGPPMLPTDLYPPGTRAQQLPDSQVVSRLLDAFGRAERAATCACERTSDSSVGQALHLNNGQTLNAKLRDPKSLVNRWLAANAGDDAVVDELFLRALSRTPTDAERGRLRAALAEAAAGGAGRREVLEDLCWGVFTAREFLFNR